MPAARAERPRGHRIKGAWLLVVPFLLFARPTPGGLVVGCLVAALGLLVRGWAAGTIRKDLELTTTGPYAYTRNPLYLGSFLIGVGMGVAGGHWLWPTVVVVYFVAVYAPTIAEETERLTELFGHRYVDYATRVPAFLPRLAPRPNPRRGGDAGFTWASYSRHREWEALLGAAAAFAVLALKLRSQG